MFKGQVNIKVVRLLIKLPLTWPNTLDSCCGSHYPQIHLSARPGKLFIAKQSLWVFDKLLWYLAYGEQKDRMPLSSLVSRSKLFVDNDVIMM